MSRRKLPGNWGYGVYDNSNGESNQSSGRLPGNWNTGIYEPNRRYTQSQRVVKPSLTKQKGFFDNIGDGARWLWNNVVEKPNNILHSAQLQNIKETGNDLKKGNIAGVLNKGAKLFDMSKGGPLNMFFNTDPYKIAKEGVVNEGLKEGLKGKKVSNEDLFRESINTANSLNKQYNPKAPNVTYDTIKKQHPNITGLTSSYADLINDPTYLLPIAGAEKIGGTIAGKVGVKIAPKILGKALPQVALKGAGTGALYGTMEGIGTGKSGKEIAKSAAQNAALFGGLGVAGKTLGKGLEVAGIIKKPPKVQVPDNPMGSGKGKNIIIETRPPHKYIVKSNIKETEEQLNNAIRQAQNEAGHWDIGRPSKAEALAKKYNIPTLLDNYQKALDKPQGVDLLRENAERARISQVAGVINRPKIYRPSYLKDKPVSINTPKAPKLTPAPLKLTPTKGVKVSQVIEEPGAIKERGFSQNVRESNIATDDIKQNLKENKLTYNPITNKETFNKAQEVVKNDYDNAKNIFSSSSGGVNADDVALGEALITKAIKEGNHAEADRLIADLAEKLTTAGQAVQAASIFKRLTPEGMLLFARRVVNNVNKDLIKKLGSKAPKIELTNEDSQFILDTMKKVQQLPDGRQKDIELAKVMQLITDKSPVTKSERFKALQRISLLLNPKTMVRNVLGNTIFGAVDNVSNVVATPIDKLVSLKTGKRTTTLPDIAGQLKSGIQGAKETIEDAKLGVDTYNTRTQYELPNKTIFKENDIVNKNLNKLDKATRIGLELGDRPFYKAAYDDVLKQQMKLTKVNEPTQEMMEQAHAIAQQRTYQDVNALTNAFKKLQNALNLGKDFGLGNFVTPFTKTPANILKRAIEYSPVGVADAMRIATKMGTDTFNQKAFVDALSRGVTGTSIIMVGYDLAKKGIITGSANKDKDAAAFARGLGKQDFAFKIGDSYYTYDWAQPASMALAIGADMFLKGKDRKHAENVVTDAIKSGGETLFKQSLLQGIQRFMGGFNPMDNLETTLINAPNQFIPTLSKQISQLSDPYQRNTYSPSNIGTEQNLIKSKIPGLSTTLEPKINTFGNPMKNYQGKNNLFNIFINPGIATTFKPNKVQKEIIRLSDITGENDMFPKVAPKYFTYKGKRIDLTPSELTTFQRTMGKETEHRFSQIINHPYYQNLSDENKVKVLKSEIDKAYKIAKYKALRQR